MLFIFLGHVGHVHSEPVFICNQFFKDETSCIFIISPVGLSIKTKSNLLIVYGVFIVQKYSKIMESNKAPVNVRNGKVALITGSFT